MDTLWVGSLWKQWQRLCGGTQVLRLLCFSCLPLDHRNEVAGVLDFSKAVTSTVRCGAWTPPPTALSYLCDSAREIGAEIRGRQSILAVGALAAKETVVPNSAGYRLFDRCARTEARGRSENWREVEENSE